MILLWNITLLSIFWKIPCLRDSGERDFELDYQYNNHSITGNMDYQILTFLIIIIVIPIIKWLLFEEKRKRRRDYYNNEYLKSDAWSRKRYVVLKRDNWRFVYCGNRATQVHHLKYAKKNFGKEPIKWLVSICKFCHEAMHRWVTEHVTPPAFFAFSKKGIIWFPLDSLLFW